jgi:hypothetical protein
MQGYPGTAKLIAVEKHSRQLENNEDGCASTATLNPMADGKHFGISHFASMSMCIIVYIRSLSTMVQPAGSGLFHVVERRRFGLPLGSL